MTLIISSLEHLPYASPQEVTAENARETVAYLNSVLPDARQILGSQCVHFIVAGKEAPIKRKRLIVRAISLLALQ